MKTKNWHTPAEVRTRYGVTHVYRMVKIQKGPQGNQTTLSFDWMESLRLMRKARWNAADFKDVTRTALKAMMACGEIDPGRKLSPQVWEELQRLAALT